MSKGHVGLLMVTTLIFGSVNGAFAAEAPLVAETWGGFEVNPVFQSHISDVVTFADLSYHLARDFDRTGVISDEIEPETYSKFISTGWQVYPIAGKTGLVHPDVPGVVAYQPESNVMVVAIHGSRNRWDWMSNFDILKAGRSTHGLDVPGTLHQGFAIKTKQFSGSLIAKVKQVMDNLNIADRNSLRIFVTGHSQGAALAHLTGVVLVQYFQKIFPGYDNATENRIQLFRLSTPRDVGDQEAYNYTTRLIGQHNDIRQNVEGDPTPSLPGGRSIRYMIQDGMATVGGIPGLVMGYFLADKIAGYYSTGYLAFQQANSTIQKNVKNTGDGRLHNILASFHLGSTHGGEDAFFAPELVDLDTVKVLKNGKKKKARGY